MGSDYALFMTSLFLYYFEDKWIWKTKRKYFKIAQKLGNFFRFIDALTAINDGGEFEKALHKIYILQNLSWKKKTHHLLKHYFQFWISKIRIKNLREVSMINLTHFHFPLLECLIYQIMYLLKYFIPHLEMKFLELAEPPLISISLLQGWWIRELIWSLLNDVYKKYTAESFSKICQYMWKLYKFS